MYDNELGFMHKRDAQKRLAQNDTFYPATIQSDEQPLNGIAEIHGGSETMIAGIDLDNGCRSPKIRSLSPSTEVPAHAGHLSHI